MIVARPLQITFKEKDSFLKYKIPHVPYFDHLAFGGGPIHLFIYYSRIVICTYMYIYILGICGQSFKSRDPFENGNQKTRRRVLKGM